MWVRLLWWLNGKESAHNVGDLSLIPGLGRSPGEGSGNLLQYSYMENSMDGGAWRATVHRVAESDMTEVTEHTHTWCRYCEKYLIWCGT